MREYVAFYVGRNGDYDITVASVIRRVRKTLGVHNSSLILVLPYHVKDEEYNADDYDNICYPIDKKTHYKAAITKRNEWMMDQTELLIAYVETSGGGAYRAVQYAKRKGIDIVTIAEKNACP